MTITIAFSYLEDKSKAGYFQNMFQGARSMNLPLELKFTDPRCYFKLLTFYFSHLALKFIAENFFELNKFMAIATEGFFSLKTF